MGIGMDLKIYFQIMLTVKFKHDNI